MRPSGASDDAEHVVALIGGQAQRPRDRVQHLRRRTGAGGPGCSSLLVLTAPPRTEAWEKLRLLAVLGEQRFVAAPGEPAGAP